MGFRTRFGLLGNLVAVLLLFALVAAACGDDDDTDATGTDGASEDTGSGDDDAADGDEAAAGCDEGDPIQAGGIFSLSGPAADIGTLAEHGAEMAVEDINAAGGILGRCLEVTLRDDESDPTQGSQAARELVDQEEVDFLVGPFLSSIIAATLEVTGPAETLHVVAGVLPDAGDAAQFPHVFRTEVVATLQGVTFVEYMQSNGWSTAAVLAVNNALGTASTDAFVASAEGTDIEIVATEFHESGVVDLTPQVRTLQDAEPDVLLLFNTAGPDQVAAIEARNALGWDVPVLGFSSLGNTSVSEALGPENMTDVFAGQAYRLVNREEEGGELIGDAAQDFLARYKEYLGEDPLTVNVQQASGIYDSFLMMAEAINAVGDLDADGVQAYLEENGYDGVKATYEYDAERHDGVGLDDLVFVQAGTFSDGALILAPNQ